MDISWTHLGHILDTSSLIRSISDSFILSASWTKSFLAGISMRKYERESSVSIVAFSAMPSVSDKAKKQTD